MYKAFEIQTNGERKNLRLVELAGEGFATEKEAVKFMRSYANTCTVMPSGRARTFEVIDPANILVLRAVKSPAPLFTKSPVRYSR